MRLSPPFPVAFALWFSFSLMIRTDKGTDISRPGSKLLSFNYRFLMNHDTYYSSFPPSKINAYQDALQDCSSFSTSSSVIMGTRKGEGHHDTPKRAKVRGVIEFLEHHKLLGQGKVRHGSSNETRSIRLLWSLSDTGRPHHQIQTRGKTLGDNPF